MTTRKYLAGAIMQTGCGPMTPILFLPPELPCFAGQLTTLRPLDPCQRIAMWLLKQDNRHRQTFVSFPGTGIIERRKRKINGAGSG